MVTPINFITAHTLLVNVYNMDDTLKKVGSALKRFWETKPLRVRQNEISVYQNFQKVRNKRHWLSLSPHVSLKEAISPNATKSF